MLRSVAQHGSVTAAADALDLTPSAVSHRLKALAREVGIAVLEPAGRGVRLTSAGHLLVGHADALYARWEQARADLAAHAGDVTGLVRLGGFPTAVAGLLSPAVARLRDCVPGLTVRVLERGTATSLRLLLAGAIDLAVVDPVDALPSTDARVEQRPLLVETLDLLVPVGHPLADSPAVALADLADEQWIAGAPNTSHHQLLLVACATAGFTPDIAHQAGEWASVCALVADRCGIALVPRLAYRDPLAELPLRHRTIRVPLHGDPIPRRRILTCVRRGSAGHPALDLIRSTLHEIADEADQGRGSR